MRWVTNFWNTASVLKIKSRGRPRIVWMAEKVKMFAKVYCIVQNVLLVIILRLYQTLHFFTLNIAFRSKLSSIKITMIQKFSERDFESGVLTCPRLLQLVNENDLLNDLVITDEPHFELPGSRTLVVVVP